MSTNRSFLLFVTIIFAFNSILYAQDKELKGSKNIKLDDWTTKYNERIEIDNEEKRQKNAADLGLPPTASWEDIRKKVATYNGLSPNASWDEINQDYSEKKDEQRRKSEVKFRGLPANTTLKEIEKLDNDKRMADAISRGLPSTATFSEINNYDRRKAAIELGLLPGASWYDIERVKRNEAENEEKRQNNAANFGLPPNASWEDIRKKVATSSGLSPDVTWDEINQLQVQKADQKLGSIVFKKESSNNFCEPDSQEKSCTTADGRVYILSNSVNQLGRHFTNKPGDFDKIVLPNKIIPIDVSR